jgi:hypothetical protein
MKLKYSLTLVWILALLAVLFLPASTVSAHTSFPEGPYTVEIGWLNEPPVVGQPNAIVVNLSADGQGSSAAGTPQPTTAAAQPVKIDYSGLTVQVSYAGQTKQLDLAPQSEDTPDNLMGVMTPSAMGKYTVIVTGKLTGSPGSTDVAINMQPEEVVGLEAVQFPNLSGEQLGQTGGGNSTPGWLPVAGLVAGIIGIILAVIALVRK